MENLTTLTKDNLKIIREVLQRQLDSLEKELNVKITVGAANYTDTDVNFSVNLALVSRGIVETRERQFFRTYHKIYGFTETDLEREFTVPKHGRFKLVGLRNSVKYPVVAENINTKKVIYFPSETVISALTS